MGENEYHIPVLVEEVMGYFSTLKNGVVVDGTLGGGGHAHAFLSRFPEIRLVGLDKDAAALVAARQRLAPFGGRALLLQAGFETLPDIIREQGLGPLAGILLDLGLSSRQIDDPSRGFSFANSGPLDMRFNVENALSAHAVINTSPETVLRRLFREFGEEARSAQVARAIVAARAQGPIETTGALAAIVGSVCRNDIKAKARVFQALRIAVNEELPALARILEAAPALLQRAGRIAIIAYHSLEDRLVKQAFARFSESTGHGSRLLPGERYIPKTMERLTKKPVRPLPAEEARNPRSRSARLRVAEKV